MELIGTRRGVVRALATGAITAAIAIASIAGAAPGNAPADYGPVGIGLEEFAYPHPVAFLPLVADGQDVRLAYMDVAPAATPNGRTVVLLHGLNFFGEYWSRTIDALRQQGFRVVVPDQIGFGRSSKPIVPYSFNQMASHTKTLLDVLQVRSAAIVGHSMGGMLATRFAVAYPAAASQLVLVNPIGLEDARRQRPWRSTDDLYAAVLTRGYDEILQGMQRYFVRWDPAYEKYVRVHYGWTRSGDWPRMARIRALLQQMVYSDPVVYDWPHVASPTLVIGGEKDGPDFPALAKRAAHGIPGARLVLLPNVGHNPHLEAPDAFHRELLQFFGGN